MTNFGARGASGGVLLLLAIAACWGLTFFSTKDLLTRMPVTDYLAVRFGIATLVLVLVAPKALRMRREVLIRGAALGVVFAAAELTQTFGLPLMTASSSGFITGLYVLFTPLLGAIMFKVRPKALVGLAVVLSLAGLAVLSMRVSGGAAFGPGEWITLVSAVLWGLHITLIGRWSRPGDVISLAVTQTAVATAIFMVGALPDGLTLPGSTTDWVWMAYFGVVVGAGTEFAQIWAQSRVEATKAAVLMVTEPLWASVFAVWFGGESLTWRLVVGGGMMAGGMLLAVRASRADQLSTDSAVPPARSTVPGGVPTGTTANAMGPSS